MKEGAAFDPDLQRLRRALYVVGALAAAVGVELFRDGLYLQAASCGVLCLANAAGLATVGAHQKTRDLYREIGRMRR